MLWIVAAVSVVPVSAQDSSAPAAQPGAELALTYSYLRANAPPAACGCFSMNGGAAVFAYAVKPSFSAVAEAGAVTASNVNSSGRDLTLSDYLVGGRYSLRSTRFTPYAQLLLGAAQASGTLAPGQLGMSSTAFAMSVGGGLDLKLTHRLALRLVQADYLLTLLPNRIDDHQNSLRVSTGIVIRFDRE
jgi:peptidoglycan-associated lipoprotein